MQVLLMAAGAANDAVPQHIVMPMTTHCTQPTLAPPIPTTPSTPQRHLVSQSQRVVHLVNGSSTNPPLPHSTSQLSTLNQVVMGTHMPLSLSGRESVVAISASCTPVSGASPAPNPAMPPTNVQETTTITPSQLPAAVLEQQPQLPAYSTDQAQPSPHFNGHQDGTPVPSPTHSMSAQSMSSVPITMTTTTGEHFKLQPVPYKRETM